MAVTQPASATQVAASATVPGVAQTQQPIAITVQLPPPAEPHWTAYVTAVATPIVAVVAAAIAGAIAYRNWRTAQYKLKFDLFEKRYKIYNDLREEIISWAIRENLNFEKSIEYLNIQRKAEFLFDRKVMKHLKENIYPVLEKQLELERKFKDTDDPSEREKMGKEIYLFVAWAFDNSNKLEDVFRDSLQLGH